MLAELQSEIDRKITKLHLIKKVIDDKENILPVNEEISQTKPEIKKETKAFQCPLCATYFNTKEATLNHLWLFHRFSAEKVVKLGISISPK